MALLHQSIRLVKAEFKALVVYNEGSNFSVGANLGLALFAANIAAWQQIEQLIAVGQDTYKALKYAPFPVVSAPSGMALGGGCEILLHSDAVQAHAETYAGLVECGVGLLPGWGGCKEMLLRWKTNPKFPRGPMPAPAKVFEMVSTATVSKSAAQAKEMLILREGDGITMNRYRLLADAKAKALALVENYAPPEPATISLPGAAGRVGMDGAVAGFHRRGMATKHDVTVAAGLAAVLSGGACDQIDLLSETDVLALERREFHAADEDPRDTRPHRAHARNGQASPQLNGRHPCKPIKRHCATCASFSARCRTSRARRARLSRCQRGPRRNDSRKRPPNLRRGAVTLERQRRHRGVHVRNGVCARPRAFRKPTSGSARAGGPRSMPRRNGAARTCRCRLGKMVEEMICAVNVSFSLYPGLTPGATTALKAHAPTS